MRGLAPIGLRHMIDSGEDWVAPIERLVAGAAAVARFATEHDAGRRRSEVVA